MEICMLSSICLNESLWRCTTTSRIDASYPFVSSYSDQPSFLLFLIAWKSVTTISRTLRNATICWHPGAVWTMSVVAEWLFWFGIILPGENWQHQQWPIHFYISSVCRRQVSFLCQLFRSCLQIPTYTFDLIKFLGVSFTQSEYACLIQYTVSKYIEDVFGSHQVIHF